LEPKPRKTNPEQSKNDETLRFSRITDYLTIGARPAGPALCYLKESGFKHVIDLNADPEEADETLRVGISYHPAEVRDNDAVQVWLAKFDLAIGIMRRASDKAEPVYLHCTYGKGRSPTMAMAYLITEGHTVEEAIAVVKSKHPDVWSPGNPTSKYTEILEAYEKLKRKSNT
jgi:dual specificity MAP kinase phosphatase